MLDLETWNLNVPDSTRYLQLSVQDTLKRQIQDKNRQRKGPHQRKWKVTRKGGSSERDESQMPISLFSTTYPTCHFPAKPHQNTSYHLPSYGILSSYGILYQIIHQREKGKTLKDSSDQWFHIISVVYHRGLPLLHFKRWASQYQQEVLPRWKMCTARARQKVLPSKWLIQLLKIACNDEMWSFPSMQ